MPFSWSLSLTWLHVKKYQSWNVQGVSLSSSPDTTVSDKEICLTSFFFMSVLFFHECCFRCHPRARSGCEILRWNCVKCLRGNWSFILRKSWLNNLWCKVQCCGMCNAATYQAFMGVSLKAKEHTCCATSTDTIVRILWKRQQANRIFHVAMLKAMSSSAKALRLISFINVCVSVMPQSAWRTRTG